MFRCDVCGRVFSKGRALATHKGKHNMGLAWTQRDIELLRMYYPIYGSRIEGLRSKFPPGSIRQMAKILNMIKEGKHLTKEGLLEIAKLRENLARRTRPRHYRNYKWFENYFIKGG